MSSVVHNYMSNASLKALEEVIENVDVTFLSKFPASFAISVSY